MRSLLVLCVMMVTCTSVVANVLPDGSATPKQCVDGNIIRQEGDDWTINIADGIDKKCYCYTDYMSGQTDIECITYGCRENNQTEWVKIGQTKGNCKCVKKSDMADASSYYGCKLLAKTDMAESQKGCMINNEFTKENETCNAGCPCKATDFGYAFDCPAGISCTCTDDDNSIHEHGVPWEKDFGGGVIEKCDCFIYPFTRQTIKSCTLLGCKHQGEYFKIGATKGDCVCKEGLFRADAPGGQDYTMFCPRKVTGA